MQVFDVHAHLIDGPEIPDHPVLTAGYSHESNVRTLEYWTRLPSDVKPNVYLALGITPQEVIKNLTLQDILKRDETPPELTFIEENSSVLTGIGEIGLDLHWNRDPDILTLQKKMFSFQLDLAERLRLPVVVHSRKAEGLVLDILSTYNLGTGIRGVILHSFGGNLSLARRAVDLPNTYISIPPMKSRARKEVIKKIDVYNFLVETDYPYIGKRLSSVYDSIRMISEYSGVSLDDLYPIIYNNTLAVLGLSVK